MSTQIVLSFLADPETQNFIDAQQRAIVKQMARLKRVYM
jgi:hypothetical protein